MIETTTTATITCDKCGKPINVGDRWYQVQQIAASSVFDGAATNLSPEAETVFQLCAPDYTASQQALAALASSV